jgi:2-keto-4-pentenoate hydratase
MTANNQTAAEWLVSEHDARRAFEPFGKKLGIRTPADAYDVQRRYLELHAATRNGVRAGYKIGVTSPAMQAMCGIDTPVAGVVFRDRVHGSGMQLSLASLVHFGIEFEILVRLGRDLLPLGRPFTMADVQGAVDAVAPAIEVVDDRGCNYASLDAVSLIADNAWNAGIVHGEFRTHWPELAGVQGEVFVDDGGAPLYRGQGRDVLGHPLLAVTWLANHLAGEGRNLRAGEVVMTGSMVTTKFPTVPSRYRFVVSGLGAVDLTLVA